MKIHIIFATTLLIFIFSGCGNDLVVHYDFQPPAAPKNVYVTNGNNGVNISWSPNHEINLAGYNVYYSNSYNGEYNLLGSTDSPNFVDNSKNGNTYYYAVTAYDFNGNESNFSKDVVYATPHPESTDKK
jgi:bacillopeptidase F